VGVLQQSAPSGQFVGFEKTASKPPAITNEGDLIDILLVVCKPIGLLISQYKY